MRDSQDIATSAVEDTPYPSVGVRWLAVGILLLLYGLALLDRQIISLMVTPVRADLGISDFQISLLQGVAFVLLYSVLGIPLGAAVDRFSRRFIIFGGVLVWAIAATCCGLAANFDQLLLARAFVGIGEAALLPAAYSMISDLFPKKHLTLALGVYTMGGQLGASASLAIGGLILRHAANGVDLPVFGHVSDWRYAFIITGLPGIGLAFLVFLIPEPVRRGASSAHATWRELFTFIGQRKAFFACHLTGFSCMLALAYAGLSWIPTYLIRRFDMPVGDVGLAYGLYTAIFGSAALILTGALVDMLQRRGVTDGHFRLYVVGALLSTLFGAVAWQASSPLIFFVLFLPGYIFVGMAGVAAGALSIVTPANLRGRVSAIYLLIVYLFGLTVGPSLVGLLTDTVFNNDQMIHWSLSATFLILGPVAMLAFFLGLKPMREAVAQASA